MYSILQNVKGGRKCMTIDVFESESWSNDACCGYVAEACSRAQIGQESKEIIIDKLQELFDEMTVDAAEKNFQNAR